MSRARPSKRAVHWDAFDTPMGRTYAALSEGGLCRLTWHVSGPRAFQRDLTRRFPGRAILRDAARLQLTARQVREYFTQRRRRFDAAIDLSVLSDFERDVLRAAMRIPYGSTASYSDLARAIGRPYAARAVGNALRKNPVPILVPCHRVIRADGTPGGYGGPQGTDEKRRLLDLEAQLA